VAVSHDCPRPRCGAKFSTPSGLAHHLFGAHGIRSERLDSKKRHERRDRVSAVEDALWLLAHVPRRGVRLRAGMLDLGEREYVRRRLVWIVTQQLALDLRRNPAEIVVVMADLVENSLRASGLSELKLNPEHHMTEVASGQRRVHKTGRRETAVRTA